MSLRRWTLVRSAWGLAALVIWASPRQVDAATITWGPPTPISGDSDVSTVGTLLSAHNIAGSTVVINGVTFPATGFGNISAHFTLTSAGALHGVDDPYGSTEPPFTDLSTDYKNLLDSGGFTHTPPNPPPPMTLLIKNLTIGERYEFQWWVNDSRDTGDFDRTTTATSGSSVSLEHNFANAVGGIGQFALGTFVADAATQTIVLQGAGAGSNVGSTQINGFQLRQTTNVGVGDQDLVGVSLSVVPNPARSSHVTFTIQRRDRVVIAVYDLAGHRRATLADGEFPAGTHTLAWDGRDLDGHPVGSGVYFYRMKIGNRILSRRGVLVN